MQRLLMGTKKGFTLTELIIVVTILGILAVLITPLVANMVENAQNNSDQANAALLENAVARALARSPVSGTGIYMTGTGNATQVKASNDDAVAENADFKAAIDAEVPTIPTCKSENWEFYVQTDGIGSGSVVAQASAPTTANQTWIELVE